LPPLALPALVLPEFVPLARVAPLPVATPELPEPLAAVPPAGLPELVLPERSSVAPLEPLPPLEETVPLELTPDAVPVAEDPRGAAPHAQRRQHAAARQAERPQIFAETR